MQRTPNESITGTSSPTPGFVSVQHPTFVGDRPVVARYHHHPMSGVEVLCRRVVLSGRVLWMMMMRGEMRDDGDDDGGGGDNER